MAVVFYSFSAICALIALRQVPRLKNTHNRLMFFILFCSSVALLVYQLLVDGLFLRMPHLFLVINVFALMAIVCMYFYARWLVDVEFVITKKHVFTALALAGGYALILLPYWSLRASEKILIIGEIVRMHVLYTARDPEILGISAFKLSNAYFAIVGVVTFMLCCKIVFRQHNEEANRPLFYASVCFALCLLNALIGTIGIAANSLLLIVVSGIILSFAFGGLYVVGEMLEGNEPRL